MFILYNAIADFPNKEDLTKCEGGDVIETSEFLAIRPWPNTNSFILIIAFISSYLLLKKIFSQRK